MFTLYIVCFTSFLYRDALGVCLGQFLAYTTTSNVGSNASHADFDCVLGVRLQVRRMLHYVQGANSAPPATVGYGSYRGSVDCTAASSTHIFQEAPPACIVSG